MNTLQPVAEPAAIPNIAAWLSLDEVAGNLGVSSAAVTGYIKAGVGTDAGRLRLPAKKVGGRWRIDPGQVMPFVDAMTAASLPASAATDGVPVEPPKESPSKARKRVADTMAALRARGIGVLPPPRRRGR